MENPIPIAENNSMPSSLKVLKALVVPSEDQSATTHVKNNKQTIILMIPYAINFAPNQQYFMKRARAARTTAFMTAFALVKQQGGTNPIHCKIISQKYSISIRRRLTQMQISQQLLALLLPLKCLDIDASKSDQLPMCSMQRQQEQQLKNPAVQITMMLNTYPVLRDKTGKIRMRPPIMPFIKESITILLERDVSYPRAFIFK